ncbi:MAG TPA: hypothetical protein DDY17_09970 [Syntrophaceae bacterium]|jgi:hypothetical protein|nr:hypothetical protein [Syntrophaceae bacterium]
MVKDVILKAGHKITREDLEKKGWLLLMHLPNGNEVYSRHEIKIMWDPQKEEVVHLFTSREMYR